jgi:hypothetical protein
MRRPGKPGTHKRPVGREAVLTRFTDKSVVSCVLIVVKPSWAFWNTLDVLLLADSASDSEVRITTRSGGIKGPGSNIGKKPGSMPDRVRSIELRNRALHRRPRGPATAHGAKHPVPLDWLQGDSG